MLQLINKNMHIRTRNKKYLEYFKKNTLTSETNNNSNNCDNFLKQITEPIIKYFQNFEIYNRNFLVKHKYLYALLGGTGIILFWKGVWYMADSIKINGIDYFGENLGRIMMIIFSDTGSLILGLILMLATGVFVSEFIDDEIIISGIKKEKQIIDKSAEEIINEEKKEEKILKELNERLIHIEKELEDNHK